MPFHSPLFGNNGRRPRTIYPIILIPLLAIVLIAGTLTLYLQNFVHAAPANTLVPLAGTVPSSAIVHSKLNGPADPQQTITLTIDLRLRNADALNSYLQDITRPKSVHYHHYLTAAQIQGAFSPSVATHSAVLQYVRASGFTITQTFNHRMLIVFKGTIGQAESVFHVTINNYTTARGQAFYSNTTDPLLPTSIVGAVQSLLGLNNVTHYHHSPLSSSNSSLHSHAKANSIQPNLTCTPSNPSYKYFTPSQIATAYNLNGLYNAGYHGEGQTAALFELDTFQMSDITNYTACYGQSHASIVTIPVDGGPPPPGSNDTGVVEVELDAELMLSAAPRLGSLRIYEAPHNATGTIAQWGQIVQDAIPVVSTSWGRCEDGSYTPEIQSEYALFSMAVAQGQSIIAASGDSGSEGCMFDPTYASNALVADDPASQPYVTGVGGTTLTVNADNTFKSETTWNNQPTFSQSPQGGASGGGVSHKWQMLDYQTQFNVPGVINQYSTNASCNAPQGKYCREVPDVSLHADPATYYLLYCTFASGGCSGSNGWYGVAGTSCAAPIWAAFMVLVNEESVKQGGFNIGFLNPLLYQIAGDPTKYSNDFHDTTTGENDFNNLNSQQYPATPGYDLTTGLGSPNAFNLATDLVALARSNNGQRLAPVSNTWYFPEGSEGGGFQEYITLQNPNPTQTSNVTFTYLSNGAPVVVQHSVAPSSRQTFNAVADLHTTPSGTGYHDGVIIRVTSGPGIVAERPIYFNWGGIASGTDVLGTTNPSLSYYFSEADTTQAGQANYKTFVSILDPSSTLSAHVTLTYYANGCTTSCPTEQLTLTPLQHLSVSPTDKGIHGKLAIAVKSSDTPIVAERALYFQDYIARAGGLTTGAASVIGATAPGNDWLFAEGFTGSGFQEYYELANFGAAAATATITLEYDDSSTQTISVPVPAYQHVAFDVNAVQGTHPGAVSAEITSDNPIVAQRLMYFHYGSSHISGGTDIVGETGPASHNVYAFAEGFTGGSFSEYLTLQNPTNNDETISATLFTNSVGFQCQAIVKKHSRQSFGINSILNPGTGGAVSMTIQAMQNSAVIVAERPMYFIYTNGGISGSMPGGTDVLGYTGS
ncbi:MAG: hypothetical protein NVSMB27_20530 [Ktedonobacteraceae bacterium]